MFWIGLGVGSCQRSGCVTLLRNPHDTYSLPAFHSKLVRFIREGFPRLRLKCKNLGSQPGKKAEGSKFYFYNNVHLVSPKITLPYPLEVICFSTMGEVELSSSVERIWSFACQSFKQSCSPFTFLKVLGMPIAKPFGSGSVVLLRYPYTDSTFRFWCLPRHLFINCSF